MPKVDVDEFGLPIDDENEDGNGAESEGEGLKSLRAALRKAKKQLQDQTEMIQKFQSKERESTITDLLKAKELSPKLAKWIQKDAGDAEVNEEFVNGWIRENGEDFGIQIEQPKDNVADETRNAHEQINSASSLGGSAPMDFEEANRQMEALSPHDPEYVAKRDAIYKAINPSAYA